MRSSQPLWNLVAFVEFAPLSKQDRASHPDGDLLNPSERLRGDGDTTMEIYMLDRVMKMERVRPITFAGCFG